MKPSSCKCLLLALSFPALGSPLLGVQALCTGLATSPDRELALSASSVPPRSVGLNRVGGELLGGGPEYAVRFAGGEFVFLPVPGPKADGPHQVSFRLDSIRRGGEEVFRASGDAAPEQAEQTARYHHPRSITEVYELRPEGVQQSFVFDELLGSSGDLVVRGRIETTLRASPPGASGAGLRFEGASGGAVTWGSVLGIDADGSTTPGTLRLDGEWLELVLPASFVDSARWPLVLDPLVGAEIEIETTMEHHAVPDCAYDASLNIYLVVWQFEFSPGAWSIRGQRINGDTGALVGGMLNISGPTDGSAERASVASVNKSNRFLVVWSEWVPDDGEWRVKGRSVRAINGSMSNVVTLAAPFGQGARTPAVGGEANTTDEEALLVWRRDAGGLQSRLVTVPSTGDPSTASDVVFVSGGLTDNNPSLPKSGGLPGRWLLVWNRQTPLPDLQHDVHGRLIGRDGTLLTGELDLADSSLQSEDSPDVDGDGTNFVVVWREIDDASPADYDISARRFAYSGGSVIAATPERDVEAGLNDSEVSPAVGYTGDAYVVAYADEMTAGGGNYDVYVKGLDPWSLAIVDNKQVVASGTSTQGVVEVAGGWAGAATSTSGAILAWQDFDIVFDQADILARLYETEGSLVTELGGGCGVGGSAAASNALVGNDEFEHTLYDANVFSLAFLILASERLDYPCGGCTLVANPFGGYVFGSYLTDGLGYASVPMPIPSSSSLVGRVFLDQWALFSLAPSCTDFAADLSDAIRVELQ